MQPDPSPGAPTTPRGCFQVAAWDAIAAVLTASTREDEHE